MQLIILLLCLVLLPRPSFSQTVTGVAGTVSHGSSITISGSSFGTKSTAAPIKYDDFQNLANGASLAGNSWTVSGSVVPVTSTTNLRSGTPFVKNAKCEFPGTQQATDDHSNFMVDGWSGTKYYIDAWHYFTYDTGGASPQNCKPIRLHQAEAGSPNFYLNFYGATMTDGVAAGRDGTSHSDSDWFGSTSANGGISGNEWVAAEVYDAWLHIQMIIDIGTPGSENGTLITYLNSEIRWNRPGNIILLANGYTNFPEVYFGNYVRSDDHGTAYAYWESVYIDNSWARIEIGNNATYANCTHREIQIPSAWSDTSVTATINRGSFGVSEAAYLFVIDSNNNPSAGYPITFVGSSARKLNNVSGVRVTLH